MADFELYFSDAEREQAERAKAKTTSIPVIPKTETTFEEMEQEFEKMFREEWSKQK